MQIEDFLQKEYGYNIQVRKDIQTYLDQWKSWYKGNVKSFHNYFIYNGQRKVKQQRYTMNMAKEISEDWSDILWSEKCKISLKDEKDQDQFDILVNELDLYVLINSALEKSGALGTSAIENEDAMTLDVTNAKTRVDLVSVDNIFPLTWNNNEITECAFASTQYIKGNKYIVLSIHKKDDNGNYVIINHLFQETNGTLTEIEQEDTIKEFPTQSNIKWFTIFKPLLTNNLFDNNPFGIPHYANAIDNLKAVDLAFDEVRNELQLGRKRIFARADMFNYENGTQKAVFDDNDISIYQLPKGVNKDDLIQSESDDLRTDKQVASLNTELNILGNKVGFGENHYHFDGTNLSTATAVVSSNSKLFRRKKKLEVGYESAIYDLVKAVAYASSQFGTYNINTDEMVIQFDDSIIEDKEAESNRAMREESQGLISKVEYRMKIFGETEEIAKQKLEEIKENNPTAEELVGE